MATLRLTGVRRAFDGREILAGIDLQAEQGETLAILGPSGSGKSTLLNIMGGLDRPDSGSVALGNLQVHALSGHELAAYRARQVGFVFQDHLLLPQLNALENVELPTLSPAAQGVSGRQAMELLSQLGVADRAAAFPAQLSGGERQRVAIARALVNRPQLLLCDEPTGSLDSETGATVIGLLLEAARTAGACLVTVTHNQSHAARFQRLLLMEHGRLSGAKVGASGE